MKGKRGPSNYIRQSRLCNYSRVDLGLPKLLGKIGAAGLKIWRIRTSWSPHGTQVCSVLSSDAPHFLTSSRPCIFSKHIGRTLLRTIPCVDSSQACSKFRNEAQSVLLQKPAPSCCHDRISASKDHSYRWVSHLVGRSTITRPTQHPINA